MFNRIISTLGSILSALLGKVLEMRKKPTTVRQVGGGKEVSDAVEDVLIEDLKKEE